MRRRNKEMAGGAIAIAVRCSAEGRAYAILTAEIARATSGVTLGDHTKLKGLEPARAAKLRDHLIGIAVQFAPPCRRSTPARSQVRQAARIGCNQVRSDPNGPDRNGSGPRRPVTHAPGEISYMLVMQPARIARESTGRIGLAIAGGGPIGGMYELGALAALEDAIEGLDLTRLEVYVGVSSGSFLAAGLANRMRVGDMLDLFLCGSDDPNNFRPEIFLRPAFGEYFRRAVGFPRLVLEWWGELLRRPSETRLSQVLGHIGSLIPNGLFDNRQIEKYLRELYERNGRSNDFRHLDRPLYVVAVDLDTGEAVRFGAPGWDDIPISRAIQASSALPGLYPPVGINGRHFVDGALRRTMHASVALDHGIDLLIGINPLVPYDASKAADAPGEEFDRISAGGLPVVLSQTFRTLLQSRVEVGLAKYAEKYPDVDQLVLEPNSNDAEMFFTNIFSFSARRRVCQHAYAATLAELRERADRLAPILAKHGLSLCRAALDDPKPDLLARRCRTRSRTDVTARLERDLDDVERLLHPRKAAPKPTRPASAGRTRRR